MSVTNGNTIRVHYTGTLTDGTQFDSSEGRDPLEFVVGSGMVIPGFDKGVVGMEIGETRTLEIPAKDAYGPRSDDMTVAIPRSEFGSDFTAEIGEQLLIQLGDGNQIPVTITQIDDKTVTLDANHKLAGKDLIPAVMKYIGDLSATVEHMHGVMKLLGEPEDFSDKAEVKRLRDCVSLLNEMQDALEKLEIIRAEVRSIEDLRERAVQMHAKVVPAMDALRAPADKLEMIVDRSYWPMPSYGDLMFEV